MNSAALKNIKEKYNSLSVSEQKVADYILSDPLHSMDKNVSELAAASEVSDSTVVRMCHHLGYKGFYQFRVSLAQDIGRKGFRKEDEQLKKDADVLQKLFSNYAHAILSIGENLNLPCMLKAVEMMKEASHVHVIAMGNTNPLAQYMSFRLGRVGINASAGLMPEYFLNNINLAGPSELILAISQSGSSRQLIQSIELGKDRGLKSIGITAYKESELAQIVDVCLLSNGIKESFNYFKNYSHLKEMAVCDALVEMVTNWDRIIEKDSDKPEEIMAESKY